MYEFGYESKHLNIFKMYTKTINKIKIKIIMIK